MTSFYKTIDNISTTTTGYTSGAGSIILASGTGAQFGSTFPLLISTFLSDGETPVGIYSVSGRSGDTLTGLTLVGGSDTSLTSGSIVMISWTAEHAAQITTAVNTLETSLAADEIILASHATAISLRALDASVVHNSGAETVAGVKTFSSTIVGSVNGNAGTVTSGVYTTGSYADPAWITSISGAKLTGTVVATNGVVTSGSYSNPSWITSLAGSKISGNITGNAAGLTSNIATSQVTGLDPALAALAPLASPALTGVPTAPTATNGTNTTQIATTAFVLANAGGVAGTSGQLQWNDTGVMAGTSLVTYAASGSILTVAAAADASKPLIVKGFSSTQSGNLQEWQSSAGTALASISAAGYLTIIGAIAGGGAGDTNRLFVTDTTFNRSVGFYFANNGTEGGVFATSSFRVKAASSIAFYPSGATNPLSISIVSTDCVVTNVGGSTIFSAQSNGNSPVQARGTASQTGNLITCLNSSNVVLFAFDRLGRPLSSNTTPTIAAGTGAGTAPTVSISGTDVSGVITVTTGSAPSASATVATISSSSARSSAPRSVILTPADGNAAALSGNGQVFVDSASTGVSDFVIKVGSTNLAATTTYKWHYLVL